MQEIWYPSTNKIKKKMAVLKQKKSVKFAKSDLLSVLEAEVKLSNFVGQYDI